jgi:apolipoprotein N-acyltransferase
MLKLLVSFLAGMLLTISFAPFYEATFAIVALAILFLIWQRATPWQALFQGVAFGFGFLGLGVSWIFVSIHDFGGVNVVLSVLATFLFIAVNVSVIAFNGFALAYFFPGARALKCCLVIPASWVLCEWLRSFLFTGFPWLFVGYTQTNTILKGYAPLIGIYGISFLVVLSAVLITVVIQKIGWKLRGISLIVLVLIWGGGYFLSGMEWTTTAKTLKVSLVQGNIPQSVKWNPNMVQPTLQTYETLTAPHWNRGLIVWPEAAVPLPLSMVKNWINEQSLEAEKHHSGIILGLPVDEGNQYYNAVIGIGEAKGRYLKRHLVPFGEFTPFQSLIGDVLGFLQIPMSDFSAGPKTQPLLSFNGIYIAPFICYEIAYENLVRESLPQSNILLMVSDDAWFGHSLASAQHLQMTQMRSLEMGRASIAASNNGLTAIVDAQGRILQQLKPFTRGVLTGEVAVMQGETPYVKWGSRPILLIFLVVLFALAWRSKK